MIIARSLFCAFVLSVLPVAAWSAEPVISGSVDVGFATANALGVNANDWSGGVRALFSFDDPGFNLQADGREHHLEAAGGSADLWLGGIDAFWRDSKGSIGLSYAHGSLSSGFGGDLNSYGAFGEWFVERDLTVRWKGGAFDATGGGHGWYGGAGGAFYPLPDLGVNIGYTYTDVSGAHLHNIDGGVEYLMSHEWPVTIGVGYRYASTTGVGTGAFMAHLSYRFGVQGSLENLDRNGPVAWTGAVSFL